MQRIKNQFSFMSNNSLSNQSPSRKTATIVNLVRVYSTTIIEIVRGLILIPVYLQFIDARLYGAWLASGSIVALIGLSDFGMFSVITQKVAKIYGKKDYVNLGKLINASMIITLLISLIPLAIGYSLRNYVPYWVNVNAENTSQISNAFFISSISTSFMMANYGSGSILMALQKTTAISIIGLVLKVMSVFATIIFLKIGLGLLSIPLALLLQSTLSAMTTCIFLIVWKKNNLSPDPINFELTYLKDLVFQSIWVFIAKLSKVIASQLDRIIVATIIDPLSTTILVFSKQAAQILNALVMHLSNSIMPSLAHASGAGDQKIFIKYTTFTIKITMIFGVYISGGVFFLNKQFVQFWVGEKYFAGEIFTSLIVVYGFICIINNAFYNILFSYGEIKKTSKALFLESLLLVPTSFMLCYLLGINGIIIASILATITTSSIIQVNGILNLLNISWLIGFKVFFKKFIMVLVPIGLCWILLQYWEPTTIFTSIILGIIYTIIFIITLFIYDEDAKKLLLKLKPLKILIK
jgi:O-antigen/teichoic acid export membrane protein